MSGWTLLPKCKQGLPQLLPVFQRRYSGVFPEEFSERRLIGKRHHFRDLLQGQSRISQQSRRTFGNRSKLPVQFTKVGLPKALRNDAQLTIFRVLQEALNNARKHAEATELSVELVFGENALRLTIADNGKGFDPKSPRRGHYGVTTMRERAAKVGGETTIDSAPGQGTRITLELPYLPPEVNF